MTRLEIINDRLEACEVLNIDTKDIIRSTDRTMEFTVNTKKDVLITSIPSIISKIFYTEYSAELPQNINASVLTFNLRRVVIDEIPVNAFIKIKQVAYNKFKVIFHIVSRYCTDEYGKEYLLAV